MKDNIKTLPVYKPGKPIEDVAREFEIPLESICKLASNENPLGSSPMAIEAAKQAVEEMHFYPDGGCVELSAALAKKTGLKEEQFVFGNGSNDILECCVHAFAGVGDSCVMGEHSFPVYKIATLLMNATPIEVPMPDLTHDLDAMLAAIREDTKLVFLPSPNNPTGTHNTKEQIYSFIERLPQHVIFVLDEAYVEYLDDAPDVRPYIKQGKNIIATRTFSKIYGLAGLRIGYGYGPADLIDVLNRVREPFNVNRIAQKAALAAVQDDAFLVTCRKANKQGLAQLEAGFRALDLEWVPSEANFLLVNVGDAMGCFTYMQQNGVIVRPIPPIAGHVRISVGTPEQNEKCLKVLKNFLGR